MRGTWRALAWKEWRELRWKLVAAIAVVCGANAGYLALFSLDSLADCYSVIVVSILPLTIFIAANTAASERSHSTAHFLNALPVASWKPGIIKLMTGATCLTATVMVAMLFIYGIDHASRFIHLHGPNIRASWYINSGVTILTATLSIYLWVTAAGVNRSDEVSAGARGLVLMVLTWMLLGIFVSRVPEAWIRDGRRIVGTLIGMSPGGALVRFSDQTSAVQWAGSSAPIYFGIALHLCLAGWFVWRFERTGSSVVRRKTPLSNKQEKNYWPRPPRTSQTGAIIWKQFRESGPVALAGLAGIVALTGGLAATMSHNLNPVADVIVGYTALTAVFSFVIAIVIGIGVSLSDSSSQINTFWRSRPIDPTRWFWIKYATGLSVLFIALGTPFLIVLLLAHRAGYDDAWNSFSQAGTLTTVVAIVLIYTAAILMMSLLRNAIYAAIFSVAVVWGTYFASGLLFSLVRWLWWGEPLRGGRNFWVDDNFAIVVLACTSAAIAIVGWLASRYDWGWGGRR